MATTYYHTVDGRIRAQSTGGVRTDYLTDALGSVVATVNSSATVVNTYRFKPYGELQAKTGVAADPHFCWVGTHGYRFSAQAFDLLYVRARHYLVATSAWSSTDPMWPLESPYAYVRGMPTFVADPLGLSPSSCGYCPKDKEKCATDCKPFAEDLPCCKVNIQCLTSTGTIGPSISQVSFWMELPATRQTGLVTRGVISIVAWYLITYESTDGITVCPGSSLERAEISQPAYSGASRHQYWGSWCQRDVGPIPPSSKVSPSFWVDTNCKGPDDERMNRHDEGFKFRVNNGATFDIAGCLRTRAGFALHPDGVKDKSGRGRVLDDEPRDGSGGCIVFGTGGIARTVRSCMYWMNKYGCDRIPLTVTYSQGG